MKFARMVSALLSVLLVTGCIHNKGLKVSRIQGKDVRVVPVRGQPIAVMSENIGLIVGATLTGGLVGGVVANAANQGATANKRATLTERLNTVATNFQAELILAEECAKLLQTSTRVKFHSLLLRPEAEDVPGRSELIQNETQPFKSKNPKAFDWHLRTRDWLKTNPKTSNNAGEGGNLVTVEPMFPVVRLINAKTFEMDVAIRVVDWSQGKIVGSRYTMTRKKITPITADSSFEIFVDDFRRCAAEAGKTCLKQLKLL